MDASEEPAPVPPQWKPQTLYDFRCMASGPRGYKVNIAKSGNAGTKRKLDEYREQVEREADAIAMRDPDAPAPVVGTVKRPKLDTVGAAKVSGRTWKQPEGSRAGSVRGPALSTTWEKKMRDKAELSALRLRKREAEATRKEALKAARERREAAKLRKEANRAKSVVAQRVSAATAKRMSKSKKQRQKLVTMAAE